MAVYNYQIMLNNEMLYKTIIEYTQNFIYSKILIDESIFQYFEEDDLWLSGIKLDINIDNDINIKFRKNGGDALYVDVNGYDITINDRDNINLRNIVHNSKAKVKCINYIEGIQKAIGITPRDYKYRTTYQIKDGKYY